MLPHAYEMPAAILILLSGIVACFAGYRLFRLVLAIYGFILGAMLASSLMASSNTIGMIGAALLGGIVGALIMTFAYFVGIALIGAGMGTLAAHVFWSTWRSVDPPALAVILLSVAGAVGAMLLQRYVIIFSTAFSGAWTMIVGGLALSGDVTAARAAELGARLAGALPAGARPADHVGPPTAKPGQRLLFVDKPERTQTQIVVGSLGTWPHDDDHMAITVANGVLGGTFTSRLMREVRSKRGWSYGASSRLTIDRQRHSFQMWTFPAAADAAACLELELGLLNDFVNDGIQADELAFIQSYLSRSYAFEIDTAAKRMHQAADVELLGLPPRYYDDHVATVRAVTLAEANASIARRIDPRSLLIVVLGTARDILEPIKERIPSLDAVEVVPFDADFG